MRDTLGLTYDVSFEVTMFDRLRSGWYSVHVTSDPEKIYDALNASAAVLRDIALNPVNRRVGPKPYPSGPSCFAEPLPWDLLWPRSSPVLERHSSPGTSLI